MSDHPSALVSVPREPTEAMRSIPDRVVTEALYWMARAYERVHSMPRVSDTELANKIEAAKADLGRARDASSILSAPAACKSREPVGGAASRIAELEFELQAKTHTVEICEEQIERLNARIAALATCEEAPAEAGEGFTEGAKLPDGAISGTDDGQTVWLESSTGGAHRLGMWGGLSLRFTEADGSSVVRDYEDVNLRAQPQAREDAQPFGYWVEHKSAENPVLIRHGSFVPASDHYKITTLYTHPAPDALRVAVKALKQIAEEDEPALGNGNTGDLLAREFWNLARQALAALQAEQKGGA